MLTVQSIASVIYVHRRGATAVSLQFRKCRDKGKTTLHRCSNVPEPKILPMRGPGLEPLITSAKVSVNLCGLTNQDLKQVP